MLPRDLKPEQFSGYAAEARNLATKYLPTLQRFPLSFLPSVLREIVEYDFKFPLERGALEKELNVLSSLSPGQLDDWLSGFIRIRLSSELERSVWLGALNVSGIQHSVSVKERFVSVNSPFPQAHSTPVAMPRPPRRSR